MKNNKKVLLYGYLGFLTNQLDGQTIKTRSILKLLELNSSNNNMVVDFFDTQNFKSDKFSFFKSLKKLSKSDIIYYVPAHNNLKYLFPIIFFVSKLFNVKIHYIVVGGWLHDFLKRLPIHRWMLRNIDGIYPQTDELVKLLMDDYAFNNVVKLHNFRFYVPGKKRELHFEKTTFNLVFMARVHPQKGINTLKMLSDKLFEKFANKVSISIYGPILNGYEGDFENILNSSNGILTYKGILPPEDIVDTLKEYDLFLFPTQYYTEGFPGSILESYLAEVPVVVSNWKYAKEFVVDGKSGIIAEFNNSNDFVEKVVFCLTNSFVLSTLKQDVKNIKESFSPEEAWKILRNNIK
ncbi:glycosyltransferase family 4 protein [Sphingobacterium anhuiense]|uniref:Glycosyltransferase family 4 protein n=1 Tax=Sphingobacterium anhuiense TaxID=493780 RepID=A0ABW5Z0L4_9SPHI